MARIIPAPAGNAAFGGGRGVGTVDHPRACGERARPNRLAQTRPGSSPRLRGTRACRIQWGDIGRIIPAPAGNAFSATPRHCRLADHPRACGERYSDDPNSENKVGSSPRLRGTLRRTSSCPREARIIPAPAGNACSRVSTRTRITDHPRACGERTLANFMTIRVAGSSPRLRGTRASLNPREPTSRIIPAPAGNAGTTACGFYTHFSRAQKLPKNTF